MLIVRRNLWMLTLLTAIASGATAPLAAQETFEQAVAQWRQVLKDLRELKVRYQAADEAESEEIEQQWAVKVAEGEQLIPVIRDLGLKAFAEDPNGDRELTKFLVRILSDDVEADRYDEAYALAKRLIELGCDSPQVPNLGGRAAAAVMEFDDCRNWLTMAAEQRSLDDFSKQIRSQLSDYEKLWQRRARDSQKRRIDEPAAGAADHFQRRDRIGVVRERGAGNGGQFHFAGGFRVL